MPPVELKEQAIVHKVTVEEIKDNELEEVLVPNEEIKIPVKKPIIKTLKK